MTERKVDVMDKAGKVLHTYPIKMDAAHAGANDSDYEKAGLAAAKSAKLVPDADFAHLRAHVHAAGAHAAQAHAAT